MHRTSCSWGYDRALDLAATCPRRSTRNTWCESSESKLHYKHRLDYVVSNRLTVSNHSSVPLNAESILCLDRCTGKTDTLAGWALMGTATRSWWREQRGLKRTKGGRKKEKCLLNDIPIVRQSRTMALCKTANNEHRRNPLSYRGPAACSPLP